jgi:type IV secretion system protein VirB9
VKALIALIAVLAAFAGTPASAQIRPQAAGGDPRLQTVDYDPGQIVQLQGAPGYQLTLELSPDEQVQNVALGDGAAWQVSVNRAGNRLFIKPVQGGIATNMTVITSVRSYNFELFPLVSPSPDMAYTVTFRYPAPRTEPPSAEAAAAVAPRITSYRISGDALIRPTYVEEDGSNTYVKWPADRPIPAVFEIDDRGQEMLTNGAMRGDEFVIAGIARKLHFRMDERIARAVRFQGKRKR